LTNTTYTDTGRTASTLYTYAVRPVVGGVGVASAEASVNVTTLSSSWQLAEGHYETAKIPLEIIAPDTGGMPSHSRYRQAYPGLRWRVPIAVLGGSFPFRYELTSAPVGMTIGERYGSADYGVLNWDNPIAGTHSVAVRVTDQEGTQRTASWSLVVTTSNTIFVDAAASPGGNGSIGSPFRSFSDFYGGQDVATYANHHSYFKNGTYSTINVSSGMFHWRSSKPCALLAYPGHSPIIDTTNAGFRSADQPRHDLFVHGITFQGFGSQASENYHATFRVYATSRGVWFENTFGNQAGPGVSGLNSCHLFLDGDNSAAGSKYAVISNTFSNLQTNMWSEIYEGTKYVFENNRQVGTADSGSRFIYFKDEANTASVRNNYSPAVSAARGFHVGAEPGATGTIEFCWNNIAVAGSPLGLYGQSTSLQGPVWDYRNTWQGAYLDRVGVPGTWEATRNVVVHNGSLTATDGYQNATRTEIADFTTASGNLNADGTLTSAGLAAYGTTRGTRGHEVI
jgi:hypothetical protein